jgi:hypothetical protein
MKYYYKVAGNKVEGNKKDFEYYESQYEDHNDSRFCLKENMLARYIEQSDHEYIDNPLIEALPPDYSLEQIVKNLEKCILYSPDERLKSEEYRIQSIGRLKNLLVVFPKHIEIARKISITLKRGYSTRNIPTPSYLRKMNLISDMVSETWSDNKFSEISECIVKSDETPMSGFTIFGTSGGGKSVAINNILSLYPQCIEHREHNGDKIIFKQLVWVKIDSTYNGSIVGLCQKFFEEVDTILGTNYLKKHGDQRIDGLIRSMGRIATIHALGTLVIDEIQHISVAKSGAENVMNFLVTLENEIKLPIILIGTYKACKKGVLTLDYRVARRASGIGEVEWGLMENDKQFSSFVEDIWQYQWMKNYSPLTPEIIEVFYQKTMGITDGIVKLFQACQIDAIMTLKDIITAESIAEVAETQMPLTNKMITALRNKDFEELSKYDDIFAFDVEALIENSLSNLEQGNELKELKKSLDYKITHKQEQIERELAILAIELGSKNEKDAIKIAKSIIKENGTNKSMQELKKLTAMNVLSRELKKDKINTVPKIPKKKKKDDDISKVTNYQDYKDKNKIKDPLKEFML